MGSQWCQCPEPAQRDDDPEAFCWRCLKPIEATDPENGERLGVPEDEDDIW